jgi:starch synthase
MRILLASSEVHPYSKTGGLADMAGALARSLARDGLEVALVTPLYAGVLERYPEIQKFDWQIHLPLGPRHVQAEVYRLRSGPRLTLYFIHQPAYFHRAGLYQESGEGYADNAERFIFFSKCVVHLARYLPQPPTVVHVHDWQTGLVPLFILDQVKREGWEHPPRTCLTIHNLAYQGAFDAWTYELTNLSWSYFNADGAEFYGGLNCLKAGICYADLITAVSPRYAREILTETYGCGLDAVLRYRQDKLIGVLNGVDYDEWKTTGNPHLRHSFSLRDRRGKAAEKLALQQELGLPPAASVPLFSNISRLVDQKGSDLLLGSLEEMLATEMQFVLLGSGVPAWERAFQNLAERYPNKVAVRIGFDHALSHRIEAGSDFYLMPSRFEPCGLNQMYSLRYGTVPVVRTTGGLDDSVIDITDDPDAANGIKFREPSVRALSKAIRKALVLYLEPRLLSQFQKNGMSADFSWSRTAAEYRKAYRRATPPD